MFPRSQFAARLARHSGILELMDDLGEALAGDRPKILMGGGNPARIPEVDAVWNGIVNRLARPGGSLGAVLGHYDPPVGNPACLGLLADYLRERCGWEIGPENLAVTQGGQTAFFFLLNLFAGTGIDGRRRKVLLPLAPEYIGYANQGLEDDFFVSVPGRIEVTGPHRFKYRIDFDRIRLGPDIGAVCLSRPTNPSGNVVSREELTRLADQCAAQGIPLLLDNAYGMPFPGIIYGDAEPFWHPNVIQTLSLSKLGLPGTRTAFVVGPPDVIREVAALNAVVGLANGNVGQAILRMILQDGAMDRLCAEVIRPFYRERRDAALACLDRELAGVSYRVHEPEGAFFLWLWLEDCRIGSREIYRRLKERDVVVVAGEYFFFGMARDEAHGHQCLRLSYAQAPETTAAGLRILGDVLRSP
jgi:valine--pyruvate aminotransferase